jgi:hypothetical protein
MPEKKSVMPLELDLKNGNMSAKLKHITGRG